MVEAVTSHEMTEDEGAGGVVEFFFLGGINDILAGQFLLWGGDAFGAVEEVKNGHAFHGFFPLQAGHRQDQGQDDQQPERQGGPMTPRPDLDIGFAGEPNHPRERRQEGQEPDRIGELEVQSGQSDISIDLLNGLGASYVARLNKPAKKRRPVFCAADS